MTLRPWRTAYGSVAGTAHTRDGAPCQDHGLCQVVQAVDGSQVLVASVADGAGSAAQSGPGARLVVESFQQQLAQAVQRQPGLAFLDRGYVLGWLAGVQAAIGRLAATHGHQPADYACTFLGAVISDAGAAFVQIGDGAIVVGPGVAGRHDWVFWPQHGEFANSTYFITMPDAAALLAFSWRPPPQDLALFSDGLERLVLDMTARTVHSPSLQPIFGWLAGTPPGVDQPSAVMRAYLNSPNVNRRTDDDKTLVMATRAAPG